MELLNPNNVHQIVLLSRIRPQDATAQVITIDRTDDFGNTVHVAIIESVLDTTTVNNLVTPITSQAETDLLNLFLSSANDFLNLPDWATWTAQQASDNIVNSIFGGKSLQDVQTDVDNLPNSFPGMKAGLKSAAAEIITLRTKLTFIAKAIVYIRNYTLRMRR